MANTYTRLYIHVIIRTKRGHPTIKKEFEEELYAYIGGIIKNQGQIPIQINGVSNHIHLLLILRPATALSDLMREVKSESSRLINERRWVKGRFRWQVGFGAFSCDYRSVGSVKRYIDRQKVHHAKGATFRQEYEKFLAEYGVDWEQQYLED